MQIEIGEGMAKFIYRMQNILQIKYKLESQAKQQYSAARAALNEEEEKLQKLFLRKAGYEEESRRLSASRLDIPKLNENYAALVTIQDYIVWQTAEVEKAQARLEEARQKLEAVMIERKAQEVLRDNAFEQFLLEEKAREGKEVDELTSYQYGQKIRASQ